MATSVPVGQSNSTGDSWQKYIDVLTNTLNQQKEKDIANLDAKLAARGLSNSGAVGAGQADISSRYADSLANMLAQIGLEKEKIQQSQNFELEKQARELDAAYGTTYGSQGANAKPAVNYWGSINPYSSPNTNATFKSNKSKWATTNAYSSVL